MEVRKGSQTPSRSVILPYSGTLGDDACAIYSETGRTAQEWQRRIPPLFVPGITKQSFYMESPPQPHGIRSSGLAGRQGRISEANKPYWRIVFLPLKTLTESEVRLTMRKTLIAGGAQMKRNWLRGLAALLVLCFAASVFAAAEELDPSKYYYSVDR